MTVAIPLDEITGRKLPDWVPDRSDDPPPVTMSRRAAAIVTRIAKSAGFDPTDLLDGGRTAHLVRTRHLAWFAVYRLTPLGLRDVADLLTRSGDHTTVVYGVHKAEDRLRIREPFTTELAAATYPELIQ